MNENVTKMPRNSLNSCDSSSSRPDAIARKNVPLDSNSSRELRSSDFDSSDDIIG